LSTRILMFVSPDCVVFVHAESEVLSIRIAISCLYGL
jgi:hypothetical protein